MHASSPKTSNSKSGSNYKLLLLPPLPPFFFLFTDIFGFRTISSIAQNLFSYARLKFFYYEMSSYKSNLSPRVCFSSTLPIPPLVVSISLDG